MGKLRPSEVRVTQLGRGGAEFQTCEGLALEPSTMNATVSQGATYVSPLSQLSHGLYLFCMSSGSYHHADQAFGGPVSSSPKWQNPLASSALWLITPSTHFPCSL